MGLPKDLTVAFKVSNPRPEDSDLSTTTEPEFYSSAENSNSSHQVPATKIRDEPNTDRSLQNLKDLKSLGFGDTGAGRTGLTRLFEIGRHLPEKARHVTEYGITITRTVPAGSRGAIDVKYFYPRGNFSAIPEISSITPKIF